MRAISALLLLLAHPSMLVVAKEQAGQDGEQIKSLAGSGPYTLKSIVDALYESLLR